MLAANQLQRRQDESNRLGLAGQTRSGARAQQGESRGLSKEPINCNSQLTNQAVAATEIATTTRTVTKTTKITKIESTKERFEVQHQNFNSDLESGCSKESRDQQRSSDNDHRPDRSANSCKLAGAKTIELKEKSLAGQDQEVGNLAGAGGRNNDGQQVTRNELVSANQEHGQVKKPITSKESEKSHKNAAQRIVNQKKVGLLEALLGDRGRSWFENKTVILDIQNGKKTKSRKSTELKQTFKKISEDSKSLTTERQVDIDIKNENDEEDEATDDKFETTSGSVEKNTGKYSRLPTFGSVPQKLNILSSASPATVSSSPLQSTIPDSNLEQNTRLPYIVYHGQARNVELTQPHKKDPIRQRQLSEASKPGYKYTNDRVGNFGRNSVISNRSSDLSYSSTSYNQSNSSSSSSSIPIKHKNYYPTTPNNPLKSQHQGLVQAQARQNLRRPQSGKASLLGYSNISNLFPNEPVRSARQRQICKSSSLINLADKQSHARQQQDLNRFLLASSPRPTGDLVQRANLQQRSRANANSVTRQSSSGPMQRQRSSLLGGGQRLTGSGGGGGTSSMDHPKFGGHYQEQQRLRPSSAAGNYLNSPRQRPSSASYRLGSAGMSPLVDPDCPVHGENLPPAPTTGQRGNRNFSSIDRDRGNMYEEYHGGERSRFTDRNTGGANYYSSSQPDLLYVNESAQFIQDDPYNIAQPAREYPTYGPYRRSTSSSAYNQKSPPVHSPISPVEYDTPPYERVGLRERSFERKSASNNNHSSQQAYYNGSSRFNLYYPSGDGSGGMRSSLAPPNEQLRRILGYKPPSIKKPVHLHPQWAYTRPFLHLQPAGSGFGRSPSPNADDDPLDADLLDVPKFAPFNRLQDNQAIRAVDFHPSGEVYAIGSNSRALRICAYPAEHELRNFDPFDSSAQQSAAEQIIKSPRVLFKFLQVHRGSIYCVSFNQSGRLLATGSNDQTVHIVKYNSATHNPDGEEFRLTMHNGTVRDLCFIDDSSGNGSSLLLSAGGGDNKIYVTDCDTITPFQSMAGHTQMVMALNHCGGAQFVSGSHDRTIRFWDLRSRSCTSIVSAPPWTGESPNSSSGTTGGPGAPVCALRVDPSGRLLASGHTDTTCMLYDIRGAKIIQTFRPHDDEIRAISFSPKSYYLLTGGYDGRLVVSDLQGDLTQPLPSACVAESQDKIVQAKWHPADFTFVSTSADKSATLWSLPGEIRN